MICPACDDPHSRVYKTRKKGAEVLRRRKCISCGKRWKTKEVMTATVRPYAGRRPMTVPDIVAAYRTALKESGLEN